MPVTLPITIPALTGRKDKPHAAIEFLSNLASISLGKTPERRSADGSVLIPSNEVTVGDVIASPWGLRDAAIGSPEDGARLLTGGEVDRPDRSKQLMSSLVPGWDMIPQSRGELAEFAIDNLTDPLNAVGAGVGVKAMKLPAKGMKRLPKNPRRGAVILSGPQAVDPTGVEPRPFYYSRLRDAAAALPGEKFKAQSIPNLLKKHAPEGFAQEEYDWVRVPEFLKGKQEVTKADLLKHLDDNAIRIDARKMAGAPVEPTYYEVPEGVTSRQLLQRYVDSLDTSELPHWDRYLNDDRTAWKRALEAGDDGAIDDFAHIIQGRLQRNMQHDRELAALGDYAVRKEHNKKSVIPDADGPATYEKYAIPGPHSDYQELLLGLAPPMKTVRSGKILDDASWRFNDLLEEGIVGRADEYADLAEQRAKARDMHAANVAELPDYNEPHWHAQGAPDNIIAHLRTTERNTPQGRTLFMDESQSQAHQAGKEFGYRGDEPFIPFDKTGYEGILNSDIGWNIEGAYRDPVSVKSKVLEDMNAGRLDAQQAAEALKAATPKDYYANYNPDYAEYHPGPNIGTERLGPFGTIDDAIKEANRRHGELYLDPGYREASDTYRPPQLPLKQAWSGLTMKELLRRAAEGGYERAGWSMGDDIQAKVGGGLEGQRIHYDRRLEKELQEIAKKRGWDVPVETVPLGTFAKNDMGGFFEIAPDGPRRPDVSKQHHSFKITPQMRKDILEKGFPLMALMPFLMGFGSGDGND